MNDEGELTGGWELVKIKLGRGGTGKSNLNPCNTILKKNLLSATIFDCVYPLCLSTISSSKFKPQSNLNHCDPAQAVTRDE